MTSPEREPSAADRPHSSSPRDYPGRDGRPARNGDGDDRRDAGGQQTTGSHRVSDDITASYAQVPAPAGRRRRAESGAERPDAPRRRRGAPPTLGLPVPPPPITKPLVSPDAPKPSGFVAPVDALVDGRPDVSADAPGRARHRDVSDPDAATTSGRHGSARPEGRGPREPDVTTGSHARVDETTGRHTGPSEHSGAHEAPAHAAPEASGRFAALRGRRGPGERPADADTDHRRFPGLRRPADDRSGEHRGGLEPRSGEGELHGIGGLRAGASRLGDALRPRGAGQTGANPRSRFGVGQPEDEPADRSGNIPVTPDRNRSETPKRGRDRLVGGLDRLAGGFDRLAGGLDRLSGHGDRRSDAGRRQADDGPSGPIRPVNPALPGDRTTGGMRAIRPTERDATASMPGRVGGAPAGRVAPGGPVSGAPTGPVAPGGPVSGRASAGGGPSRTVRPGGGPSGPMPDGRPVSGAGPVSGAPGRPMQRGGGPSGPLPPGVGPNQTTGGQVPMAGGPGGPMAGRPVSGAGPVSGGGPRRPMQPGGGPSGPNQPGAPMPPGGMRPGGGPSGAVSPVGGGRPGASTGGLRPGGGPSGPIQPGGPVPPGGGPTGGVRPGGGPSGTMPPMGAGRPTSTSAPISGSGGPISSTGPIPVQADGTAILPGVVPVVPVSPTPHRVTASMAPSVPVDTSVGVARAPAPGIYGHAAGAPAPMGPPSVGAQPVGPEPIARLRFSDEEADRAPADRKVRYANQVHAPAPRGLIVAVLAVVVALLGIIPAYLLLSQASTNQGLAAVKALDLPSWASGAGVDQTSGNQWCVSSCMKSERTMTSTQSVSATDAAYQTALRKAGWVPAPHNACPPAAKGVAQSCWVLDREQLNVLISPSPCSVPAPAPTEPSFTDPAGPTTPASPPKGCAPTTVAVSVFDRIDLKPGKT